MRSKLTLPLKSKPCTSDFKPKLVITHKPKKKQLKGLIQGYVNLTTSNLVCTNSLKFLYFRWSVLYNGTAYLILLFIFGKWLIYVPYVQNFD
jgi:hypothetical protein